MKLMKLYYLTLEELKDLPDKYGKHLVSDSKRLQIPQPGVDPLQNEGC
jgi:hypothetical protein